jgi:NTE family protein
MLYNDTKRKPLWPCIGCIIRHQRPMRTLIINILIVCLLFIKPSFGNAQKAITENPRPKVALVLSGGGAKGFSHIGVLKVLEEEHFPIDFIIGTSMGSLIGGAYAIGYNASELERLAKSLNWGNILSDEVPRAYLSKNDQVLKQRYSFSLPITENKPFSLPQGLIKGQNILNLFCGIAGNVPKDADFERFPIPFACVATDLETGKEVVLRNGFLPTAMFSSMAIPIVFQPSDRDGLLLADGGLVNNFPTDVAKKMGADIIIGVDIRDDTCERKDLKSISSILNQLIGFFDQAKDSTNKSLCSLIIRPNITGYTMSSFNSQSVDTLILRGEDAANGMREQLRQLKVKYKLEPHELSRALVKPDYWHITDLTFSGNCHLDDAFLQKTLDMEIPGDYASEDIKDAIDRIYGLGGFDRIYYNLVDTEHGKSLNLTIITNKVFTQSIGFKANTTDAAAILLNTTRKNYGNTFGLLSASAELSVNPGISLLAESNKTNSPTFGVNIKGKYQNYNVFEKGDKLFEAEVFYSSGSVYLYKPFLKRYHLGFGLQEEYYQGDIFNKEDNYSTMTSDKTDILLTSAYSFLSFDDMDDYYFPKKGTNLYAEFSLSTNLKKSRDISPVLLFKMNHVTPIAQKTALLFNLYSRALYDSDFPKFKKTMIGGEPYSQYFNYHLPFVGLSAVNLAERFTYIGLIGLRVKVFNTQYVSLLFNSLSQNEDVKPWENAHIVYGGGVKYAIKTFLGPLDMTVGYSDLSDRLCFSANFGYWF